MKVIRYYQAISIIIGIVGMIIGIELLVASCMLIFVIATVGGEIIEEVRKLKS